MRFLKLEATLELKWEMVSSLYDKFAEGKRASDPTPRYGAVRAATTLNERCLGLELVTIENCENATCIRHFTEEKDYDHDMIAR